jgi:hypothetical protein
MGVILIFIGKDKGRTFLFQWISVQIYSIFVHQVVIMRLKVAI